MTCMGLTHNFSGLLAGRFFLGLSQAGIFPGINYILSCWYKRSQLGIRTAIFFSAAAVSGSFGGLLAAAIQNMDGIGGKGGWAWIFILEGLVTVVMGIASIWLVPNFPETATFLSEDDRAQVISLLNSDKHFSEEAERFNLNQVWCSLKDWKTWTGCIVYTGCAGPLFAFALFLPSIIAGLGDYNNVEAQLYTVPPYAVAAVTTILVGYVADKTHQRGACNIAASILAIAGFVMLLTGRSARVQYPGTFLAAAGIYPCISNSISWISNNVEGAYKRGISLGIIIGFGNLNGIVSCYIYRSGDAPLYILGHAVVLGYLVIFLLGGSVVQRYFLQRENRIRLARKRDDWVVGKADKDIALLGDMRYAPVKGLHSIECAADQQQARFHLYSMNMSSCSMVGGDELTEQMD